MFVVGDVRALWPFAFSGGFSCVLVFVVGDMSALWPFLVALVVSLLQLHYTASDPPRPCMMHAGRCVCIGVHDVCALVCIGAHRGVCIGVH